MLAQEADERFHIGAFLTWTCENSDLERHQSRCYVAISSCWNHLQISRHVLDAEMMVGSVSYSGDYSQSSALTHLAPSSASSLTPTHFKASFTTSIKLLSPLPLGLLPASSNLRILPLIYSLSLSLDASKPSRSGTSGLIYTSNLHCPSDVLIPDPIHPSLSQRETQKFYLLSRFLSVDVSKPHNITALTTVL